MEVKAVSKYVRISPQKTRLVADLVRGKKAVVSQTLLDNLNKRAAKIIGKTLNSAVNNAVNKEQDPESFWIKEILIDGGPVYKRYMPRAMGRANTIRRPTSHIKVVLSDKGKHNRRK